MTKETLKGLLLALATVSVLLGALEGAARVFLSPVSRVNFTMVPNSIKAPSKIPGIPYLLRPNGVGVQKFGTDPRGYFDSKASLTYRINSLGFRGDEIALKKDPGVFRVVGLGDSFTFGSGVRNQDTFFHTSQEILHEANPERQIEVLNLGAPGYNTVNEVNLLETIGVKYNPDLVVICFFLNDTCDKGTIPQLNTGRRPAWVPFWRRHSRMLDQIAALFERRSAATHLAKTYRESVREDAAGWVAARDALSRAVTISQREHFKLMLMIFPVLWHLSNDYPFTEVHEIVASYSKQLSIPVLDLLPSFAGYDGPELWVHPNNQHPNEIAHAVAGKALARFILNERIL